MRIRSMVLALATVLFFGLAAGIAQAQPATSQPNGRQDFQARMNDRIKEQMGATDDEWKVLQPRIQKVQELRMQAMAGMRGGGRGGNGGGRRGGGNGGNGGDNAAPAAGANAAPLSAIAQASQDLRQTLDNKDATPDQIKAKLDAFRKARDAARADLVKAQQDLQGIVNQRQEAVLVTMNLLD